MSGSSEEKKEEIILWLECWMDGRRCICRNVSEIVKYGYFFT